MKTLVYAALLCGGSAVCAAQAASTVTLYGTIDAGLQYQSIKIPGIGSASQTGVHSGGQTGNRWGLRGSEDLGNGLRAIFTLEAGYNVEDGTTADSSRFFNRQIFAGLASDRWGTLTLGRQYNQGFLYFGAIGPFGNGFGLASQSQTFGNSLVRYDNLVKYETPAIGGAQASIGYSNEAGFGTGSTWDDTAVTALTGGIRYTNGPWAAAATFDRLSKAEDQPGSGTGTGTLTAWQAGIAYDFEVVRLSLAIGQDRGGRIAPGNNNLGELGVTLPVINGRHLDGFRATNYLLGLTMPMGDPGTLLAALTASDSNLEGTTVGDNGFETQYGVNLGYTYSLSKRTNLYAVGTYLRNASYIDGSRSQEYRVGLLHRF